MGGEGGAIWPINEHKNIHFGNEDNIYINSKFYEESDYDLDLDFLTIVFSLRVSYPKKSVLVGK